MADWSASMQQTFEFYEVDPGTWKDKKRITNIKSCTIDRDSESQTRYSASFDITDSVGECYIRVYLITIQNGVTEKYPLGTFLVQTPSSSFDGKVRSVTMDAYSPLIELKEKMPAVGYYVPEKTNVMNLVYDLLRENVRAPIGKTLSSAEIPYDFVADVNDTWLSYLTDLIGSCYVSTMYEVQYRDEEYIRTETVLDNISGTYMEQLTTTGEKVYKYTLEDGTEAYYCIEENNTQYKFELDEMGRILFAPIQDFDALQPVWTYTDDNSSILYPELSMQHDLYGVPNVVEVVYSNNNEVFYARRTNEDESSPISIPSRGREIVYRVSNPDLVGSPTQARIDEYADQLLRTLSSVEYTITYTHGYCPVRVGDCIRLNYSKAGLENVKARVISQSIKCEPGCPVTEKAVFTKKLWR